MQFKNIIFGLGLSFSAIAQEPILTGSELEICVVNHQNIIELEEEILNRQLEVLTVYSDYEIADRNHRRFLDLSNSVRRQMKGLQKTDILYAQMYTELERNKEDLTLWLVKKEDTFDELKNLMYGIKLKIQRLRNLYIISGSCTNLRYSKSAVNEVCEEHATSNWCLKQF